MAEKRFSWEVIDHDCLFYDDGAVIDYDDVVDILNEQHENLKGCNKTANNAIDTIKALTEENQTLNNKLNNFKLHSKDLESENQLLKKALRELLENDGNAYMIDLMDKIFDLNYREWYNPTGHNSEDYVDWEEELQKKELERYDMA